MLSRSIIVDQLYIHQHGAGATLDHVMKRPLRTKASLVDLDSMS